MIYFTNGNDPNSARELNDIITYEFNYLNVFGVHYDYAWIEVDWDKEEVIYAELHKGNQVFMMSSLTEPEIHELFYICFDQEVDTE